MTTEPRKLQLAIENALADASPQAGTPSLAPAAYPQTARTGEAETGARSVVSASRALLSMSVAMIAVATYIAFDAPMVLLASFAGIAAFNAAALLKRKNFDSRARAGNGRNSTTVSPSEHVNDRLWEIGEASSQIVTILESLGDIAATCDMDGRIVFSNATFREATGQQDPAGLTLAAAGINPVSTDNGMEIRLGSGDDVTFWTWHETTTRDPASGQLIVLCFGRNATAERMAAQALVEARGKAEAASAAKSRFLATVSHEIRTPLNGILGMTHLLGNTEVSPEQASYIKTIGESGQSLLALIEDLLDVTSIEAGRFHLRRNEGDLHELIHGVAELMASRAHDKGIEIGVHIAPDVPRIVETDLGRLRQVLFNLIGNAVKFTDKGGVLIEVAGTDGQLCFRISDTGPGVRPKDRERIFQEFERADHSSTRRHDGAGLGLAISARIIEALNGAIDVESTAGSGSTFVFHIPLEAEAKEPEGRDEESETGELFSHRPLAGHTVLVLAPRGPVGTSLVWSVRDFGGVAESAEDHDSMIKALTRLNRAGNLVTDILIDRRISDRAADLIGSAHVEFDPHVARTLIIAPEDSRDISLSPEAAASAWLVRPVRARSLLNVLANRDDRDDRNRIAFNPAAAVLRRPANVTTLDILLAEDNPVNALVVRSILAREGHRVSVVESGRRLVEEALDRPEGKSRFDLVITDLSMPELDGKSAILAIRSREEAENLSRLPIIVLSADGQASTRDEMLNIGADGHAEKPVDPAHLLSLVLAAADAPHAAVA